MSIIFNETKNYCEELLSNSICSNYQFHNLQHTREVYRNALLIADSENLTSEEKEILAISALFHDTGYSQIYKGHELVSMHIAEEFLLNIKYKRDRIDAVLNCIAATIMPQKPKSILEKIICDADLAHLAASNYLQRMEYLRKEWSSFLNLNFSNEEWMISNVEFLRSHSYHSQFGKTVLEISKWNNLRLLEESLAIK